MEFSEQLKIYAETHFENRKKYFDIDEKIERISTEWNTSKESIREKYDRGLEVIVNYYDGTLDRESVVDIIESPQKDILLYESKKEESLDIIKKYMIEKKDFGNLNLLLSLYINVNTEELEDETWEHEMTKSERREIERIMVDMNKYIEE